MLSHLRAILWLIGLSLVLCCIVYPGLLLLIGQAAFPVQANGNLLFDRDGLPIGSRLIAQPFIAAKYFQPRPSAVAYSANASGASNWGASNVLLRDRVARQLGPIVRYRSGPERGHLAGPDIEQWFRHDRFQERPGIVAQWAQSYPTLSQNWVKAAEANAQFVAQWQAEHEHEVTRWIHENPQSPAPRPENLAVLFFMAYSKEHPGSFPVAVERRTAEGKTELQIEPLQTGPEIQAIFFDMWLRENPHADLEMVPADMVMASGSGLDPHITRKNALYQLDRVASSWSAETHRDVTAVRKEIEELLQQKEEAPFGGLVGVELINVLEVNLALQERYATPANKGQ